MLQSDINIFVDPTTEVGDGGGISVGQTEKLGQCAARHSSSSPGSR